MQGRSGKEEDGKEHPTIWVHIPLETVERGELRGKRIELIVEGDELLLKPRDENLHLSMVNEAFIGAYRKISVNIPVGFMPTDMLEDKKLKAGMKIGFRINEKGQLLFIPEQA